MYENKARSEGKRVKIYNHKLPRSYYNIHFGDDFRLTASIDGPTAQTQNT